MDAAEAFPSTASPDVSLVIDSPAVVQEEDMLVIENTETTPAPELIISSEEVISEGFAPETELTPVVEVLETATIEEVQAVAATVDTPVVQDDLTPEAILCQAVASLKKISDATDAKKQSALDLEIDLRNQITEEIEAHKAKIAQLEESAENARVLAEQIEEDGKKTKERISLLEKELEVA